MNTALVQVLGAVAYGELKAYEGAKAGAADAPDEATRKLNREGKFGGFSIGGSGQRVDLTE